MLAKLSAAERQQHILDQIQKKGSISVADTAVTLKVSEMTVRRDLMELEKRGLLQRRHGGATLLTAQLLDDLYSWETRVRYNVEAKVAIVRAALSLISEGDKLVLHSGTTVALLARMLRGYGSLTIATNSILTMEELLGSPQVEVILTGGILNPDLKQLAGPLALQSLNSIRADKVFLSCSSISTQGGLFFTSAMDEVALEQASIRNCREAYLLVDHSKFQRSDFWVIGQLTQLKAVITDAGIPPERVKEMEAAGIPCIVA
ncbi:MAG: DeoR/GlpR family DNA-binding transcription regulator [Thermostichus sp. DRC_bins_24]